MMSRVGFSQPPGEKKKKYSPEFIDFEFTSTTKKMKQLSS
jgi:hypothetical protein